MKDKIDIRKPTLDEVEAYRDMRLKALESCPLAFTGSTSEAESQPLEYWQGWIQRSLDENGAVMFMAYLEDKMVGMISFEWEEKEKLAHVGHIAGYYVDDSARGMGVGGKLLAKVIDVAKERNLRKLRLEVTATNPARSYYVKKGFKEIGIAKEEIHYEDKYHDLVEMEMFL